MILIDNELLKGNLCIEKGIDSGCPFCKAINADFPKVRDKVRLLSNFMSGLIGEVIEVTQEEIMVHLLNDPKEISYRVLLKYELVEPSPFLPIPDWAPQIHLRYAGELHNLVINFCQKSLCDPNSKFGKYEFINLIVHIWFKRLPIEAEELWKVLQAHGIPLK